MREYIAEIIPNRLYQRGQFLTWTIQAKKQFIERYKITTVVNLWGKVDSDLEEVKYIVWPLRSDDPGIVTLLIQKLAAMIFSGEVVLIHCEAGVNRSVWLSAKVVCLVKKVSGEEALELVTSKVSRAKINAGLLADLTKK